MENILLYIDQFYPSLTRSEKLIATEILANPQAVTSMTISELADKVEVSSAAITRFCKRLGLSGYQDFKMKIAKAVFLAKDPKTSGLTFADEIDIHSAREVPVVIENIISTVKRSLELLQSISNPENIARAVGMIRDANRINIIGVGASGLGGLDLYQKLLRLGLPASYNFDTHLQMVSASTSTKKTLAIVFSYSGETSEIIEITKQAKALGAKVIGITRIGDSSLNKLADISLPVPNTENICRNGAFISRLDQLIINDMLFFALLCQHYDQYYDQISKTWEGVATIAPKIAHGSGRK